MSLVQNIITENFVLVLPATLCVRERANFGRLGSFSFFSYKKDIGIMWDFDKKKCGE